LVEGKEDNLTIRLIKIAVECSNSKQGFGVEMIVDLCNYFWKVEKGVNIVNIFITVATLVQNRLFCKSTLALLHLLRVLLEGKKRLPETIDNECIPSSLLMLTNCFRNYNEIWADMQEECWFELGG